MRVGFKGGRVGIDQDAERQIVLIATRSLSFAGHCGRPRRHPLQRPDQPMAVYRPTATPGADDASTGHRSAPAWEPRCVALGVDKRTVEGFRVRNGAIGMMRPPTVRWRSSVNAL